MLSELTAHSVDATGTIRRLQALVAMGHPPIPLAFHLSVSEERFWGLLTGAHPAIDADTAAAAAELFESWWDLRIDGPLGDEMRAVARQRRWVGPLAWDDIDDPSEKPNLRGLAAAAEKGNDDDDEQPRSSTRYIDEIAVERALRGEPVRLHRAERLIAIARLHARRLSDKVIARTLHVNPKTVLRARQVLGLEAVDPAESREAASA